MTQDVNGGGREHQQLPHVCTRHAAIALMTSMSFRSGYHAAGRMSLAAGNCIIAQRYLPVKLLPLHSCGCKQLNLTGRLHAGTVQDPSAVPHFMFLFACACSYQLSGSSRKGKVSQACSIK